jgi:hypothetical protein
MNKFNTIVFAALTLLGSAQAMAAGQTHNISFNNPALSVDSKLTRAEVKAEFQAARAAGAGEVRNISFNNPALTADSKLTRDEVVAEFVRARDAGELDQANFEYSPHKLGTM